MQFLFVFKKYNQFYLWNLLNVFYTNKKNIGTHLH
jgi:hypothetical protein